MISIGTEVAPLRASLAQQSEARPLDHAKLAAEYIGKAARDPRKAARKMLDDAGLTMVKICASNDLDEELILSLKHQGAAITVWGVGTNLITSKGCPALGGVYKMAAEFEDGRWVPRIKLSDNPEKVTTPGLKKVFRLMKAPSLKAIWFLWNTKMLPRERN